MDQERKFGMIQSIYSNEEMDSKERKESSAFKMPKNIRQIGQVDLSKKIYAEDYVMTYIKQLAEKTTVGERKAVLLGQYIKSEGSRHIFINGAVEIIETVDEKETMFSNEVWSEIYDCIKKYYTNVEIVGWYITKKDVPFDVDEHITKMHLDNFAGQDKTLLVYDALEKEEAFYFYDKGKLKKQSGYYIYYDRNEEMQNYMVENKENVSTDEGYMDVATQKIRKIFEAKNEANKQKSMMPLVYTASSLLAVVVLVIGATMVSNYDKMKDTGDSIAVLSDAVSNTGEKEVSTEVTQVETVPSTIEGDSKETNTDTQNSSIDNADVQAMIEENEAAKEGSTSKDDTTTKEDETKDDETKDDDKTNEDTETNDDKNESKKDSDDATTKDSSKKGNSSKETENSSKQTMASNTKYTVKKGDTLVSISTTVYGTIKGVDLIKEFNNIENQDLIYEGQEIVIPEYK